MRSAAFLNLDLASCLAVISAAWIANAISSSSRHSDEYELVSLLQLTHRQTAIHTHTYIHPFRQTGIYTHTYSVQKKKHLYFPAFPDISLLSISVTGNFFCISGNRNEHPTIYLFNTFMTSKLLTSHVTKDYFIRVTS